MLQLSKNKEHLVFFDAGIDKPLIKPAIYPPPATHTQGGALGANPQKAPYLPDQLNLSTSIEVEFIDLGILLENKIERTNSLCLYFCWYLIFNQPKKNKKNKKKVMHPNHTSHLLQANRIHKAGVLVQDQLYMHQVGLVDVASTHQIG